jgi:hypothetical protein
MAPLNLDAIATPQTANVTVAMTFNGVALPTFYATVPVNAK